MAITIRQNCFETNSSSTHSLCILPDEWSEYAYNCDLNNPYIDYNIKVESFLNPEYAHIRTVIITTTDYYKRDGSFYLIQGDLHKIQFLLSDMGSKGSIFTSKLKGSQLEKFQQIYKTINKHLNDTYQIKDIKINKFGSYNDGHIITDLCGFDWKDSSYSLEEINKIVLKIITDNSIVFICYSDEIGPFPEEVDLEEINISDLLIKINENNKE